MQDQTFQFTTYNGHGWEEHESEFPENWGSMSEAEQEDWMDQQRDQASEESSWCEGYSASMSYMSN